MIIITKSILFLIILNLVNTKLTVKEIYKQFGDEVCIEGDIEVNNNVIISFGQSGLPVRKTKKNGENEVIGSFFPDAPIKTPVTLLNELANLNKLEEPYYHLQDKKGPDHKPTFTVLLLVGGQKFISAGGNIKAAKNGAAQAALESDIFPIKPEIKSPGQNQDVQTPMTQLNNIALKLKMKVEYVREKYQPEAEIYGGSNKGFISLGKKKSYEERLNASIYKTVKKGPNPDGDDTKGPFTFLVKVGDKMEFRANGITKQGAKHNAAERALDAFKEMSLQDAIQCLRDGNECNDANVKSPINILQEMAQYRKFSVTYTLVSETGLPHKKTFQIRCEVAEGKENLFTDGEGASKKEAKKIAAMKMVGKLSTSLIADGGLNVDAFKKTKKRKKKSINRSDLLLLKEDVANKVASVYDYFISQDESNAQKKQESSMKKADDAKGTMSTEDFQLFDDTIDYNRRLRSILDDYNINEDYVELIDVHRKIAVLIVPTNPKLICIAEAVDIPSAKELVSYHALTWILSNSDFQFKNMYHEGDNPDIKEAESIFIYSNIEEKTEL